MIKQNKKAQQEGISFMIKLILVLFAVTIGFFLIYYLAKSNFLNFIPGLGEGNKSETIPAPGDITNQPVELRNPDSCIDADFFWSDKVGNILNGKIAEPGTAYVAIRFHEGAENLPDFDSKCGDYALLILDKLTKKETPISFRDIKEVKLYPIKLTINTKEYHLVEQEIKDPGIRKSGEYDFRIGSLIAAKPPVYKTVRAGASLTCEHNVAWVPGI